MTYSIQKKVRFADCDMAGIVFYPRYFEMLNAVLEDWFQNALGCDFATLHQQRGLGSPTVSLECEFVAPAMLGEQMLVSISVEKLGNSSCSVLYTISGDDRLRMRARATLVCMDLQKQKSAPWPDDIRRAMETTLKVAA